MAGALPLLLLLSLGGGRPGCPPRSFILPLAAAYTLYMLGKFLQHLFLLLLRTLHGWPGAAMHKPHSPIPSIATYSTRLLPTAAVGTDAKALLLLPPSPLFLLRCADFCSSSSFFFFSWPSLSPVPSRRIQSRSCLPLKAGQIFKDLVVYTVPVISRLEVGSSSKRSSFLRYIVVVVVIC